MAENPRDVSRFARFRGGPGGGISRAFGAILAGLILAGFFLPGCGPGQKEAGPRVVPAEGASFPAVSALAWLDAERFVSVSEDGAAAIWEAASGRMEQAFSAGEEIRLIARNGEEEAFSAPRAFADAASFPAASPDGTKKISPLEDGGVLLADAAGNELARFYGARVPGGPGGNSFEWISVTPGGFFNASFHGSGILAAEKGVTRYSLSRFSGGLFRPDLVKAALAGEGAGDSPTLETLFGEEPPEAAFLLDEKAPPGRLKIKISEREGGTGMIALYRRSGAVAVPAGLFRAEEAAEKRYTENGRACYELSVRARPGTIGVSAFNGNNTAESERIWLNVPALPEVPAAAPGLPVLRALVAGYGENGEEAGPLAAFLSFQEESGLYSAVETICLSGESFNRAGFNEAAAGLCAGAGENDILLFCVRGSARADSSGDLLIAANKAGVPVQENAEGTIPEGEISGDDLLVKILNADSKPIILLELDSGEPEIRMESALHRFRLKLGPRAMFAAYGARQNVGRQDGGRQDAGLIGGALEKFRPDFSKPGTPEESGGDRLIRASAFINALRESARVLPDGGKGAAARGNALAFLPLEDFPIASRFGNSGELKFQTMASGMLKIDQVDKTPIPLPFGETMIRPLPPGSYIIDMMYRNGYRETRTLDLRAKDSKWVIFTYTPPLLVGDFSRQLPALGINASELNPANYRKVDTEAMESMGMAPYYVAFLAGEKFYREENYDKAIAEYSRAISLKADYAEAYASRGNAQRKKGELDKALEDYSRALDLNDGFAEVYNYRGYVYARKGDQNRAISDYTQAIRLRPGYADARFNRAYAYSEQGAWEKAVADYTEVINLEPSNAVAYSERGKAYRGGGEESKAEADYAAAEKLKNRR